MHKRVLAVEALLLLAVAANGACTLIGAGIGAASDRSKKDVRVAGWQFEQVAPGTRLNLFLKNGSTVAGTYLDRGVSDMTPTSAAGLPARPSIRLLVAGQTLSFATDDVALVEIPAKRHGKRIGTLVGLAVDVVVFAVLLADQPPPCVQSDTNLCIGGSCPLIYSHDGSGYTLDAEMFGGSLFQASQRADRARLARLAEQKGQYRIRMTNEQQEIQQVDQVRLLVIDHPEGVEIVPTLEGELMTFGHREAPIRAADLSGADVLTLVRDDDETSWISTPFGRRLDDPTQLRDGIVLDFIRPVGAETVTLAFTVRSTAWASTLLNRLVGLQGRDVDRWRERMNAVPAERTAFHQALAREGLLRLSVWDGQAWRDSAVLANIGPAAPRRQAVRLDLSGISGSSLRVRLDGTPGLWTVDAAAADYSSKPAVAVRHLDPIRATSQDGRDLRSVLSAADGRYYTMPTTHDAADLVFDAPPPVAPGQRRSFIFEAAGYYSTLVPPTEPRVALFDQLVSTPGAFARYSLGLADEELNLARASLAATVRGQSPAPVPRAH